MKVYLFDDYLKCIKSGNKIELDDSKVIAEIEEIKDFPHGLVEIGGKLASPCALDIGDHSAFYINWADELLNEDECSFEQEARCPHCGKYVSDSWEFSDEDEHECESCGTKFSVNREIEVTYSTEVISRNTEVLNLNLVQGERK